jgi:Cu-Zn family superoxide dismutase
MAIKYRLFPQAVILLTCITLSSCRHYRVDEDYMENIDTRPVKAICVLYPEDGLSVKGTLKFKETMGGVRVRAKLKGLPPGTHGVLIHRYGDCSDGDDAASAGNSEPGRTETEVYLEPDEYFGDLDELTAKDNGKLNIEFINEGIRLEGPESIIGRSVVVYSIKEEASGSPGISGVRIACGVIGIAKQ